MLGLFFVVFLLQMSVAFDTMRYVPHEPYWEFELLTTLGAGIECLPRELLFCVGEFLGIIGGRYVVTSFIFDSNLLVSPCAMLFLVRADGRIFFELDQNPLLDIYYSGQYHPDQYRVHTITSQTRFQQCFDLVFRSLGLGNFEILSKGQRVLNTYCPFCDSSCSVSGKELEWVRDITTTNPEIEIPREDIEFVPLWHESGFVPPKLPSRILHLHHTDEDVVDYLFIGVKEQAVPRSGKYLSDNTLIYHCHRDRNFFSSWPSPKLTPLTIHWGPKIQSLCPSTKEIRWTDYRQWVTIRVASETFLCSCTIFSDRVYFELVGPARSTIQCCFDASHAFALYKDFTFRGFLSIVASCLFILSHLSLNSGYQKTRDATDISVSAFKFFWCRLWLWAAFDRDTSSFLFFFFFQAFFAHRFSRDPGTDCIGADQLLSQKI
jgi:hypothetical protein